MRERGKKWQKIDQNQYMCSLEFFLCIAAVGFHVSFWRFIDITRVSFCALYVFGYHGRSVFSLGVWYSKLKMATYCTDSHHCIPMLLLSISHFLFRSRVILSLFVHFLCYAFQLFIPLVSFYTLLLVK